jgi:two-component sensor histidine kinase
MTCRRFIGCAFALAGLVWLLFPACINAATTETNLPLLTLTKQVRDLPPAEALRGFPVRLRGVVTYYRQEIFHELTIQDDTGGIYVTNTANKRMQLNAGDLVEIEGVSGPGSFAPVVVLSKLTVTGHGPLPPAREVPYAQLATGAEDCQWVQVRGIVHAATVTTIDKVSMLQLDLATAGGRIPVRLPRVDPAAVADLVDAQVTLNGVAMTVFNYRRQMINARLSVPNFEQVTIERPAPQEPFAATTRTINSLHRFDSRAPTGHRVKVQGVVLMQEPGQSLFIRDDTQGLCVKTRQATPLRPGDRVEVLGFPASGEFSPTLEDAIYRKTAAGPPPQALRTSTELARKGTHDIDLVQLDGQLQDIIPTAGEHILVIKEKDWTFNAHLSRTNAAAFALPPVHSRVRLHGICLAQLGNQRWPQSFRLVLRSPADIQILTLPGWWTRTRVLMALGATSVLCVAAFAWVVTLRRQVRAQTHIIQQKIEREAVLEERTRIAREFHDTLEQQLGAVLLQMQAARSRLDSSPDFVRRVLHLVESMLRHTQSEARHSVWDLRARALENGTLGTALATTVNYVRNGSGVEVKVAITGDPRPLPGRIENHLLRIGQEATANAIKHGAAANVGIELNYQTAAVRLIVEDDGKGFTTDVAASGEAGHFGLLGMRERAEKIGGRFNVASAPGNGTRIEVAVPVGKQEARDEEKDTYTHC